MHRPEILKDHRYIGILCLICVFILIAGVAFRPKLAPPSVPSELELQSLQLARQRLDLDRRSMFYERKAADLLKRAAEARGNPQRFPFRPSRPGEPIILVSTTETGQTVWAASATAGTASTRCGSRTLDEVATTISIPITLSNAVAFNLDDQLAGFVVPCGERSVLTTSSSFEAWTLERAHENELQSCCGIRITPELAVVTVDPKLAFARGGLRTGDKILSVNGQTVTSTSQLHAELTRDNSPLELVIEREKRSRRLKIARDESKTQ